MTPDEKERFHAHFPALDVDTAVVTGDPSNAYNCLAWTVGYTDRWLWPGADISNFDTFYAGFGLARAGDGPIAAWGTTTSNMTHGSISGPTHGPRWESKCGADLRIQHGMSELAGSLYGRILAFYRPTTALHAWFGTPSRRNPMKRPGLTTAQKRQLAAERDEVSKSVRAAFDRAFAAWKKTWFRGGLAISSNPQTRAAGPEFDALIALGPAILPLVVHELSRPENFIALTLYEAIQPEAHLHVQIDPAHERVLEGEQGRAQRVVQAWLGNR